MASALGTWGTMGTLSHSGPQGKIWVIHGAMKLGEVLGMTQKIATHA
jgi:hypothetical protein